MRAWLRTVVNPIGFIGILRKAGVKSRGISTILGGRPLLTYAWSCKARTLMASTKMMVDTGATENHGLFVDNAPEKEDDGGYASGGCRSEDGKLSCGYSSFRGKRASMEDFYDVKMSKIDGKTVCMFGIFDGHGGSRAAEYLKKHLFENLMEHPQFMSDTKLAICETYKKTDIDFLDAEKDSCRDDGSTASTAVLVGNHLYVANVGDSRTITSKSGKATPLSEDHKPNRPDERKRIESAGGVVMWAGTWRVGGVLAMSRAFGNRMLKQFVVAEPEIQDEVIIDEHELLVLASDGLWDVVPNEDAVSIARTEEKPEAAARKLTETAFTRGSADNITCIVVKFHHDKVDPVDDPQRAKVNTTDDHHHNKVIPADDHHVDKAHTDCHPDDKAGQSEHQTDMARSAGHEVVHAIDGDKNVEPADGEHSDKTGPAKTRLRLMHALRPRNWATPGGRLDHRSSL